MSGRVNVKFVVILSAVLFVVMGVAVVGAALVLMKSGADHAALAQKAEAAGDWKAAERSWGNAVSEEQTNPEYLEGYLKAIQNKPNATATDYQVQFEKYRSVLRTIAEVKRTDLDAHERYFDEILLMLRSSPPSRSTYEFLISEVDRVESLLYGESPEIFQNLRRHRGEAIAIIAQIAADIDDDLLDKGIEDLEQASQVRPDDISITEALYTIHSRKAERAKLSRRDNLASESFAAAHEAVAQFAQANPDNIAAQFLLLRADIDEALRGLESKELFGPELSRARQRTLAEFEDRTRTLAEEAATAEPAQLNGRTMNVITSVIVSVLTEDAGEALEKVWDRASENTEADRSLQFAHGQFLRQLGKHPEAIEIFEKIADLPDVPVSTEGWLRFEDRNRALYFMADAAIERWTRMEGQGQSDERKEWLERSITYRDRLAEEVPEDRPMMQFLDARLAMARGEYTKADRLFREFNNATSRSNPEGLKLAAAVAKQLGNQGLELEYLEAARQLQPNDINTLFRLASVHMDLRDYSRAETLLEHARDIRPDIPEIEEQLNIIKAFADSSAETDPVKKVLIDAMLAQDSGELDTAINTIQEGLREHPDEVPLIVGLGQLLNEAQRYDELTQVVARGLELDPDNTNLKSLKILADIGGDIEKQIGAVEGREDIPEIERQIALHRLHLQNEDAEAAAAALAAARAIDPQHRLVVIYSFDEALRNNDLVAARRLYEANKDRDIDGAEGLAIRARIELAEGNKDLAKRTLQAAVERGSVNAVTIKLLADVQMELGETFQALQNYKRAIAVRPDNVELIKGYIVVLTRLGRMNEALSEARSALSIGQRDAQFREMWLHLEGMVGDKQLAYERRLTIAENEPENQRNSTLLIGLALDLRKFDEARNRLDAARSSNDSLALAALDARWHADRNDLQKAINVFSEFIASPANDLNDPSAYLAFGDFLIQRGLVEQGITTLRQAQSVQSKESPIADAILSDKLFELRRYEEAVPVLKSLIAADFQMDTARGRLIESYLRLRKPELAREEMNNLSEQQLNSLSIMLMRADMLALEGKEAESNDLIDQAIQDYPEESLAYLKRATRLMSDRQTMPDAVADLTRAIELNPTNADAYRFRSLVHAEMGRMDDAARDIVASAEANPDSLQLRLGAINRLIELDREQMASDLVDTALKRRPTDLSLMMSAGDMFTNAGLHRTAMRYYERAWEQSKTFAIGQRLASSILEQPRPDLRRARQIAQDPNLTSAESPATYMLRAKIENSAGNSEGVRTNLTAAYELIKNNPQQLVAWTRSLPDMLETTSAALQYLAALDREKSLSPWASLFRAQLMLTDDASKAEGIRQLGRVIDAVENPQIKQNAYKFRSMARYGESDYEGAAGDMRKALEIAPSDAEVLNNLAYTLAKHLNQAAEAEPMARKAVELDPNSRASQDTLGLVLIEVGKAEEAVSVLQRALSLAQTDVDKATVLVHLARALLASGNPVGAQDAAGQARTIMAGDSASFDEELRTELEQIQTELRNQ